VGVGTKEGGQLFAEKTNFPPETLYADPVAACHKALGYNAGFLPDSDVNGYLKLLPMLAGIGSPGTVQVCILGCSAFVFDLSAIWLRVHATKRLTCR
jgi:AhpC/TSA antioxidant enzyme